MSKTPVPVALRRRVAAQAQHRCGYCLTPEELTGELVTILNPRMQRWEDHFAWSHDGTRIIGQTPTGRATVQALRMNDDLIVKARERWVKGSWWPPTG
jgi:hypothetical protein